MDIYFGIEDLPYKIFFSLNIICSFIVFQQIIMAGTEQNKI